MLFPSSLLALLSPVALAAITVKDPSDVIDPEDWAADNAVYADYDFPFIQTQPRDIPAENVYNETSVSYDHTSHSVDANDTSVILVTENSEFNASYVDVLKFGTYTNLLEASFWGFNAAVLIANGSTANLDHINVTVHNGAANIYAYGTGTVVNVNNAWLYSSGPVSHGLYGSGNGTIIGRNIHHYSGGMRSSSFSGDTPAAYIQIYDSFAHTSGIGSASYYVLGEFYVENCVTFTENAPTIFMDGAQSITLVNTDSTAGLLGGVVSFSSQTRLAGAEINFVDSSLHLLNDTPAFWFGNIIATLTLNNTVVVDNPSDVLVVANYSQMTQDFNGYYGYDANSGLQPAIATVITSESNLKGDLVTYNGSAIALSLDSYSTWSGGAYSGFGEGSINITLSANSNWTLTKDSKVLELVDADTTLSNIISAGFTLYYDSVSNDWLQGQTVQLAGGGSAVPA